MNDPTVQVQPDPAASRTASAPEPRDVARDTDDRSEFLAHTIEEVPAADGAQVLENLPAPEAADVAEYLDPETAAGVLAQMEHALAATVIADMEVPEAAMV